MMLRLAVERLLETISEALRHIPVDMKAKEPKINWRRLADLGNWLRHAYHRTDPGRKCRSKLSEPRSKKFKPL